MKSKFRSIIALFLLMMGVVAWLPSILVNADTPNPVITIVSPPKTDATSGSVGSILDCCKKVNEILHDKGMFKDEHGTGYDFLTYAYEGSNKNCSITVNMTAYKKLANSEQQKVMQIALDTVYDSTAISRINRNKIYNELCELDTTTSSLVRQLSDDTKADFAHAYKYFKPFSSPIGILLGLIALAMFTLLAITGVVDIAYITLPFVQLALGKLGNNERPKFVSLEAANAIKEMESKAGQEYVNPLGLYFKTKIKQYIALAICLLYLVSGQIFTLVSQWIDYFIGFLKI